MEFSVDVKEGVKQKIEFLFLNFKLNKEWRVHEHFQFVNFKEAVFKTTNNFMHITYNKAVKNSRIFDIVYHRFPKAR